jgi:chorismate mutase
LQSLENFRHQIDEIDDEIISLMANRMKLADKIGEYKKRNNISILQTKRWSEILQKNIDKGGKLDLSDEFMTSLFKAVHQESINRQHRIMKSDK